MLFLIIIWQVFEDRNAQQCHFWNSWRGSSRSLHWPLKTVMCEKAFGISPSQRVFKWLKIILYWPKTIRIECWATLLPGFHLLSSSVTMSTPLIRFSQNSSRFFDSGKRPEIPAITISSILSSVGWHEGQWVLSYTKIQNFIKRNGVHTKRRHVIPNS